MAEENAFPYSKWLATLHPRHGIPWNLMLVVFAAEIIVGTVKVPPIANKTKSIELPLGDATATNVDWGQQDSSPWAAILLSSRL